MLCNVGCCYHHIDEEFYKNPYLSSEEIDSSTPSFPMSSHLKKLKYQLGRNARMIAAQPMDRLRTNKQLPNESLLWRSILQHILLIHLPDLHFANQQVDSYIIARSKFRRDWGLHFRDPNCNYFLQIYWRYFSFVGWSNCNEMPNVCWICAKSISKAQHRSLMECWKDRTNIQSIISQAS